MELTDLQKNRFKKTWEKETGEQISDSEAQELLESLLNLLIPVYKPELID